MKTLIKTTKAYLAKVFSDLHNIILGTVVGVLIVGGGGIYALSQNLWMKLKSIAQSTTPLWATVTLGLIVMEYIHIRIKNQSNSQGTPVKPKIDFIENGNLKWKVTVLSNGEFNIEDIPFCIVHDIKLRWGYHSHDCYYIKENNCKAYITQEDCSSERAYIQALAEKKYRKSN